MSEQLPPVRLVSVVMPAHDAEATIATQLAALNCQTYPGEWEVIVVENGSKDGTRALLRSWQQRTSRLRVVHATAGCGVNRARNIGCHQARGELVLCCDADDVAAPGWMAGLVDALRTSPAAGGALERRKLNSWLALAARPPKESDALLDTFAFLPYPAGANCGFRKELWHRLGGFDESYRYGGDDVEFFWRAQLAGYRLAFAPDAVVHYRLRAEPRAIIRQFYRYGRSHPQLYRDFAGRGMPRSRPTDVARAWWRLLNRLADLVGPADRRVALLAQLAMRVGRVVGSARCRRCYL
ncbi:glycosyltransferase [Kitasatospora sp. RB6PN24]|uniref:glycosyltransferase n=1 Tax=Kitasatospora humi TaxID=2893891 RepID=UPI001E377593|nr:glycosyltransferase [Kitasatospora humi]MCC9305893.1 glycosyltransferase [Kitasatospora humi]